MAGITKQALHTSRIRQDKADLKARELIEQADKMRKEHPGVGCRKIARSLVCPGWGRDKIEALLLENGYRVSYPRRYTKTTDHRKAFYYPNLIEGMELNAINQVVQTDITYYRVKERFFYIVFLMDVYSRRIVGHGVSKTLHARANINALNKMIALRKDDGLTQLIHHSDRGSQYVDTEYRSILCDHGITPSMCKNGWENAYTERVNRTIKEEYLDWWEIPDYATLRQKLNQAVRHYNHKRGHESLHYTSPVEFEQKMKNIDPEKRPKTLIYKHVEPSSQQGSSKAKE